MALETGITFFLITLFATATPGPTMLYIASCGLSQGTTGYLGAACGVLLADFIYFMLTISGLSAILLTSYELFLVLKWLGVAYLIYLGFKLILSENTLQIKIDNMPNNENLFRDAYLKGFLIHLANPKTILFFSALLPQFIGPQEPLLIQLIIIGSVLAFTQAGVSILYGAMANRMRMLVNNSWLGQKLNIISGVFIILAGLWLATVRRA